ncbi:MAG: S9 family peptidase [Chloroflexota bacterium]|nr:S9 family peptidase [Chloroflexota bacterium]
MAVAGALSLREPRFDGSDVYWIEGRPEERGRQVIVRWSPEHGRGDLTPAGLNARTMAHEYGGGAYAVDRGTLYFSNLPDGRVYRQRLGEPDAEPITPAGPYRYADLVADPIHDRLLSVREDHTPLESPNPTAREERGTEPENTLVAIEPETGGVIVLASGHDFYSTPRPAPDGRRLAWLAWRHPNMPWDGTELWVADIDAGGRPAGARRIAGGAAESIVQPEWGPGGELVFVSDRSGWWNLYRWVADGGDTPLAPMEAEFAGPQWAFGMSWFGITPDGTVVAVAHRASRDELWRIPPDGTEPSRMSVPDEQLNALCVAGERATYIGRAATEPPQVVLLELAGGQRQALRTAYELAIDRAYLSRPEPISFPTTDDATAHALFYRPTNPDVDLPPAERPPLVVMIHGGPTSHAGAGLDLEKQVFTSRGFAVVDVDYRGSSGYGRRYMRALDGRWGIADVDDCVSAARYLAERGDVDPARMAIRGGSAGGYTTLCALVFHDVFAAGASHYGVGDLEALARDTHKFESRYLDRLVAPYPQEVATYRARSPIYFTHRLTRPLIVLQGLEDRVVPPAQAEQLVAALRQRRIAHAYLAFEGEGHGFRQADNIRRAQEAELSFYAQVFGFALADDIEPVDVQFLGAGPPRPVGEGET